jgi:serine/threonine protein kinase
MSIENRSPRRDLSIGNIVEDPIDQTVELGADVITPEERAALEATLDFQHHPNSYAEKAWQFVKPWLMNDPVKGLPAKQGAERLAAHREQRRQLFQAIDRIRADSKMKRYIGQRQMDRFEVTMRNKTYTFMRPLGEGGFGTTFEALADADNRQCIVKCTPVNRDNVAMSRKAVMEVAVMRKLNGLHAPQLLDAQFVIDPNNDKQRMLMLAMTKVPGDNAWKDLEQSAKEPPEYILQRMHTLLLALRDIHQAGVLHLDLKPEHLFFSEDGMDVNFIDFGIAGLPDLAEAQSASHVPNAPQYAVIEPGSNIGTNTYMAPEKVYDAKADVFAAGRVIHNFLYRSNAAEVDDRVAGFKTLSEPLKPLSRLAEKMITPKPNERYDLNQAIAEFESLYPEYAQPDQVTTVASA